MSAARLAARAAARAAARRTETPVSAPVPARQPRTFTDPYWSVRPATVAEVEQRERDTVARLTDPDFQTWLGSLVNSDAYLDGVRAAIDAGAVAQGDL